MATSYLNIPTLLASVPDGPLNGVVVASMGSQICGSWTSEQLARKGALVIKIEKPGGDPKRLNSCAAAFRQFNAGKLSVQFDKTDGAQQQRMQILNAAHVIVDNRSNPAKNRDQVLRAVLDDKDRPQPIVYCSISGYGRGDDRFAYDRSLQAAVGMADINGELIPFPLVDMSAGTEAAKIIVEQLFSLAMTEPEEKHAMDNIRVDLSMAHVAMSLMSNMAATYMETGETRNSIVPFGLFETKDGKIGLAIAQDHQFTVLCMMLGISDLAEQYPTNQDRLRDRTVVESRLADAIKTRETEKLVQLCRSEEIPAEPVRSFAEAFDVFGKQMIVHDASDQPYLRSPGLVSRYDKPVLLPAPEAGEHNQLALSLCKDFGGQKQVGEVKRMIAAAKFELEDPF